jgi:hypothetical protein
VIVIFLFRIRSLWFNISFNPKDWFDAGGVRFFLKPDGAVEVAVVGNRERVHAEFLGAIN